MKTIEEIVASFEGLLPASQHQWNVLSLVPGRLHISRSSDNRYAVFLEGELASFGKLPQLGGLDHSAEVTALPSSRTFAALKMTSHDPIHGNRVLAHIAYELARRLADGPDISNEDLFRQVEWVFLLLGDGDALLTPEKQTGLVGECTFLRQLLIVARSLGIPPATTLERWWGHNTSRRDFASEGIAVEVKTTGQNVRRHSVGSIEQLDPQSPGEKVYVYSLGIKTDASSARKLPHFVADVEAQLVNDEGEPDEFARAQFVSQLMAYGYDINREAIYLGGAGYLKAHLPGALFRTEDLESLRYESFVDGKLPAMVSSVSYVLNITSDPVTETEEKDVLLALLTSPAVTYQ